MPRKRVPGIEPMSIANMLENGCTAVSAYCEGPGCQHEVSISVVELYRMGFKPEDAVIDIGWKLKCSRCGHKGAETRPDWSTKPWRSGETGV
jgi:hypothetical protein